DEYFFFCCTWIVNSADKTAAANYLGISRTTFWRRLKS
ncbi:helix-turn-helix domain-containing protein, partial [Escherichia coli]